MKKSLASVANSAFSPELQEAISVVLSEVRKLSVANRVKALNEIRTKLHDVSPFWREPVDCVLWFPKTDVIANDYNPNSVAPPEMKLLETSILQDGYTQPIVGWREGGNGHIEVVDGFHRNRVGKESPEVADRICGYLPVAVINPEREEKGDRMAATIRHNRARGKHKVEAMSDIVVELKRRNWSSERIGRELGMEQDEILRLCQITGLAELFTDQDFSQAWEAEGQITESDFVEITDDVESFGEEAKEFRTVNTSDEGRVFHTYDKWECYQAGFYNTTKLGWSKAECEEKYRELLTDIPAFTKALKAVTSEWKHSCEHYLTNAAMNRIAWLGQASACYALGIPSSYRGGFYLLTEEEQSAANEAALVWLNKWLVKTGREAVTMDQAYSGDRQSDIY